MGNMTVNASVAMVLLCNCFCFLVSLRGC